MKPSWIQRFKDMGGWNLIPDRRYTCNKVNETGEIYIYEQIGEDWWSGGGITAKRFAEDLKALGDVKSIDLHINSPGGVIMEADAIYTALVQHKAKINVSIDGLAASAASYIAMAGDAIAIAEHAKFMIHNAWGLAIGNASELRKLADVLETLDSAIRLLYQRRTGNTDQQLKDWMAEEKWFVGQQAVDQKFADTLIKAKEAPKEDPADIHTMMRMRLDLAKAC